MTAMYRFIAIYMVLSLWLGLFLAATANAMDEAGQACGADYQKSCANVQPGGGRVLNCLREHDDALSASCQQMIKKL